MSERDLRRIEVLSEVRTGRRTVAAAAAVLSVSERQAYRLLARYEVDGGSGLIHKARGRVSNRSRNEGIRKYTVELVKTRYADFGPTLATEVLLDKHQLQVGASMQDAEAQKVEARTPVHLPLDELESVDLPFDVALTPWQCQGGFSRFQISFEP